VVSTFIFLKLFCVRSLFIFSPNIHLLKKLIKRKFQEAFLREDRGEILGNAVVWDEEMGKVSNLVVKSRGPDFTAKTDCAVRVQGVRKIPYQKVLANNLKCVCPFLHF
jgi:hypothetical protein